MLQSTSMAFGSPGRYIQGPGEISRLPFHTAKYGKRIFAIIDEFFYNSLTEKLSDLYAAIDSHFESVKYHTEITAERIRIICGVAAPFQPDVIVGIGGGKALDTAKAVAHKLNIPVIIIPTSASTDAPTSAMSVIYNDAHEHTDVYYYTANPNLVLVDSEIITQAPVRFLVSGMGDALATIFEARATLHSNSANYICQESGSYRGTRTAMGIAELCYNTILEYGELAKLSNEQHVVTEALEAVIEANILMSGLGFENVGCAGSHVICNGITATPNGNKSLHGEKVAFGVICQLIVENAPKELLDRIIRFNLSVGLPVCLDDMWIEPTEVNLDIISSGTANTEWTREPFYINDAMIKASIKTAHALGKQYKALKMN